MRPPRSEETAARQLAADQAALQARHERRRAGQRPARPGTGLDCGGLALGLYTGALTAPQPAALRDLTTAQNAAIDSGEVNVVAQVVVTNLGADIQAVAADGRQRSPADRHRLGRRAHPGH